MSAFLTGVGFLLIIGGLAAAIFWRGRRRKGLITIAVGFVVGITGGALGSKDVAASKAAGFASVEEYRTATAAGYSDSASYRAAQQAAAEKAKAEAAARAQQEREKKMAEDNACKTSLKCWGEKYMVGATVACVSGIERMAKYDQRWTDGMLEPKFSHYRWRDQGRGLITYIGDKAQFQNGFGAWSNMIYECDYDPTTDRIADVRIRQGRL